MIRKIFLFVLVSSYICIAYCQSNSTQIPEDVPGIPPSAANKRFRYLVGGKTAVDLTNYQNLMNIQRLSQAVIQSMNRNWYGTNSWALANVISATTQVVSGQSYDITFTIGQTICQNNRLNPPAQNTCQINFSSTRSFCQCIANVVEIPWYTPSVIVNSSSCKKVYY